MTSPDERSAAVGPSPSAPAGGTSGSAPVVRCRDVVVRYDGRSALEIDALDVPAERIVAVIGPNGAGKSTLLGAIAGIVDAARGSIEVLGGSPGGRNGRVGYVLQGTVADGGLPLTVREVVRMGRYAQRGWLRRLRPSDRDAVDRAMERAEVADLADRHLSELSAGQRQRVYLAQGLAQQAELLLLDEPATGLDVPAQERIAAVLAEEREAGRTVVFTTHAIAEAAAADVVVLLAGRVVAAGPPDDVLRTETLRVAYRGQVTPTPSGAVMLDDPHHGHEEH